MSETTESDAFGLLSILAEDWHIKLTKTAGMFSLVLVDRRSSGPRGMHEEFRYLGSDLATVIRAAWAGEPAGVVS